MPTTVRLAQPADAEGISQVILAALHSSNAKDYPADVIARVASNFTADAVLALLTRRVVLVAVQDDAIVATAALDANVVRSVFVNPALQGQYRIGGEVARDPGDHVCRVILRVAAVQGRQDDLADTFGIGGLGETDGGRHAGLLAENRDQKPPPY